MKESVRAAESYVKSRSLDFGIKPEFFSTKDIHVHVPEGATPKDGPSAGVGMCTAVASVLSKIPVRADVAMTGEITLRGEVLKIGGLKEKLLAARRGGIKTVLIPKGNVRDLKEIPDNIKDEIEIMNKPDTGVICFRVRPMVIGETDLCKLQEYVYNEASLEGARAISTASIEGKKVLRLVSVSPEVTVRALKSTILSIKETAKSFAEN